MGEKKTEKKDINRIGSIGETFPMSTWNTRETYWQVKVQGSTCGRRFLHMEFADSLEIAV